jgi:hypothetical protein
VCGLVEVGCIVGEIIGASVGKEVGCIVGEIVGASVGKEVGLDVESDNMLVIIVSFIDLPGCKVGIEVGFFFPSSFSLFFASIISNCAVMHKVIIQRHIAFFILRRL